MCWKAWGLLLQWLVRGSVSENHPLYVHVCNRSSRSPGSKAEPLGSDANGCLEPSESAVLRWYEWEDAGEQRLPSLIGEAKDCREVGNRDRKRGGTYIELNLCKISSAVLQDAVGWGHRKKFPLTVIQKCLLVMCNVFCASQEGQVYIFHWK